MKYKKVATVAAGVMVAMGGAAPAFAHAGAEGLAADSPGVISGNLVQAPLHIPVNVCGNTVNVIALLNPVFGTKCGNA
ncbi:chaplin [Streptomyces sp. NPDC051219]|uniref:chaplin n=1 Tax=Streptomyces sp. NPDC051219 TaxID=3155283 RepID=UPI00343DDF04